jgi:rare lipoprotein A
MASWYGSEARTANGERFDPDDFSAAYRTIAFGTRLGVVNERNGRSVIVRVNDPRP